MRIKIPSTDFSSDHDRNMAINHIATIIHPNRHSLDFKPYKKTSETWVLDDRSNWLLEFKDGNILDIRYRYQRSEKDVEGALFGWLQHQIGAKKVTE